MSKPTDMSRDRVHFTVPAQYLSKSTIRDCLVETLGLNETQLRAMGSADQDLHIICRPSQFARMIILRHIKYGEPNNMACLNMRLVTPPREQEAIDVSRNPNKVDTDEYPELNGVRNKKRYSYRKY